MGRLFVCRCYSGSLPGHIQHGADFETGDGIEAQQAKTDLLTDISKLHEQHLHKLDSMIDTNTVHKIRDTMTGSFDASELLQQLDQLDKPFQSTHWVFSSPAAMIGIALLIALLSLTISKSAVQSLSYNQHCLHHPPHQLSIPLFLCKMQFLVLNLI